MFARSVAVHLAYWVSLIEKKIICNVTYPLVVQTVTPFPVYLNLVLPFLEVLQFLILKTVDEFFDGFITADHIGDVRDFGWV